MLLEQFRAHVQSSQLFQKNDQLVVAVSGGADSVALCELCHLSGYSFQMAHCNFQLRGAESERDEEFVKKLAEKYGVALHHTRFDTKTYAQEHKVGTQVAARELRYQWFDEIIAELKKNGAAFLLTAHHANDNIETLLMNFFKGTGIRGLQGIPERNNYIIRPLLFATRKQILQFLQEQRQSFVEDSSNLTEDYTRNYFRRSLIPSIEEVFPNVEENLIQNIIRFKDAGILYNEIIKQKREKLAEVRGNEVHIPVLKLQKIKAVHTVLYEIVKNFDFLPSQINSILHLLKSESGKFIASSTHRIIRNRAWLIITPLKSSVSQHILIHENQDKVTFDEGTIHISKLLWKEGAEIVKDTDVALIDADAIKFPLLLRKWKQGDYFYPLGMDKKKKLSRFFIDLKMSVAQKENIWVIEQDRKIIWIAGLRIDNRFKITAKTMEVLRLTLSR